MLSRAITLIDENQQALSNNTLEVPIRSVLKLGAKKIKEVFNRLIQNIYAKSSVKMSSR
jgi:hypothetical protein